MYREDDYINCLNISFETRVSQNQNLHFEYLTNSFKEIGMDLTKEKYLTLNIVNSNNEFTNLGLLFSDECTYSVKCAIFDGCTDLKFKDRKEFGGSILKQVDDVYQFINVFNRISETIVGLRCKDNRDYPEYTLNIGLITADEVSYIGGVYGTSNPSYYLYSNYPYWTLTPFYAFDGGSLFMLCVSSSYSLYHLNGPINGNLFVKPVINLNSDILLTGSGTIDSPYEVSGKN